MFCILLLASQDGSVNSIPAIVIATSGDNVTLECESSSGPNNTFIWFHNISSLVCKHNNCSNGIFTFDAQEEGNVAILIMNFSDGFV